MERVHNIIAVGEGIAVGALISPKFYRRMAVLSALAILPLAPVDSLGSYAIAITVIGGLATLVLATTLLGFQNEASYLMPRPMRKLLESALLLIGVSLIIVIAIMLGLSSLTYALVHRHGMANPFALDFTRLDVVAFFLDQAVKGALFGLLDALNLHRPSRLAADFSKHWPFALIIMLLRLVVMTAILNAARNMYISAKRWRPLDFNGERILVNMNAIEPRILSDHNIRLVLQANAAQPLQPDASRTSA